MKKHTMYARIMILVFLITSLLSQPPSHTLAQTIPPRAPFTTCAEISEITPVECIALLTFFTSTGGDGWINHTNWFTTDSPSEWFGVTVAQVGGQGHLTKLNLPDNNLSGTILLDVNNLTYLTELDLSRNFLTGSIPNYNNLVNLTHLLFSDNQFSNFNQAMFANLTRLLWLDLSNNVLSGPYPSAINNLDSLERLDLSNNQFFGPIPETISNLEQLKRLELGDNQFSGSIPSTLGSLSSLTIVNLSNNLLTGSIPTFFGNLTNLTALILSKNALVGNIPSNLGNLVNLEHLALSENQLTGQIPTTLGNLPNLRVLILSLNELDGEIPAEIFDLTNLSELSLQENNLTGTISSDIGFLQNLNSLSLSYNQLSGTIPVSIGSLTNLISLQLSNNQLEGTIPDEFGNLVNLTYLVLSNNLLIGNIPGSLGNLTQLQWLYLDGNQLTGPIPASLGNLTLLNRLYLQNNRLGDSNKSTEDIPSGLGNLLTLQQLDLSHNRLTETVPAGLWELPDLLILDLSANLLSGNIPTLFNGLRQVTRLLVSSNNFSGAVPHVLGELTQLTYLDLANNQFQGALPTEIGTLANLEYLLVNLNSGLSDQVPLSFLNLTNLYRFDFFGTSICEPLTPEYFSWKASIPSYTGTNKLCGYPQGIDVNGRISDQNNVPLAEVTLQIVRAGNVVSTTASDAGGNYHFFLQQPGNYQVIPRKAGHQFFPQSLNVQVYRGRSGQNFLQRPARCYFPGSANRQPCLNLTSSPFINLPVVAQNAGQALQDIDFSGGLVASWFNHSVVSGSPNSPGDFFDGESFSDNLINSWLTCFDRHCSDDSMGTNFSIPVASSDLNVHPVAEGVILEVCRRDGSQGCTRNSSLGRYIVIRHQGTPYATLYAHLAAVSPVTVGSIVQITDIIGTVGGSGGQPLDEGYWPESLYFKVLFNGSNANSWTPNDAEAVDPFGWSPYDERADNWNTPSVPLWVDLNPTQSEAPDVDSSEISSGGVTLDVPADSLSVGQIITLANSSLGPRLSDDLRAILRSFQVKVLDSQNGWALVNNISSPILVAVDYAEASQEHINLALASIYQLNLVTQQWNPVPTTLEDNVATATIHPSGKYTLAAPLLCPLDIREPFDDKSDKYKYSFTWNIAATLERIFDTASDQDWIAVDLIDGASYLFETSHPSTGINSILSLYGTDGKTLLALDDKNSGNENSQIEWTATTSGTHFLRVSQADTSLSNCSPYQILRQDDEKHLFLPIIHR